MSHNRSFRWSDEQRTITSEPLLGNSSLDYLERENEHALKRSDLVCVDTVNQQEVGNELAKGHVMRHVFDVQSRLFQMELLEQTSCSEPTTGA